VSILMIVEVMDWAPHTLTHREYAVLLVLAEDCRDNTRETWRSVASPDVLRRARVGRAQMYVVLGQLIAKGALERSVGAAPGRRAKYRIPRLTPLNVSAEPGHVTCQQNRDIDVSAEPRHVKGQRVSRTETNVSADPRPLPFSPSETLIPPELPPVPEQVLIQRAGSSGPGPAADQDQHLEEDQERQHLNGHEALRRLAARQAAEAKAERALRLAFSSTAALTGTDGP
jgi:hypothetical protein